MAVLAGLLSAVPADLRRGGFLLALVALVLLDVLTDPLPLPQRSELIPQDVFTRGMGRGLFRFGAEYGTGVRTLVPSAAPWLVLVWLLVVNLPWWQGIVLGLAFGLSRALAPLQFVLVGQDGWQAFLAGHSRLLERSGTLTTGAALLVATLLVLR